MGEKTPVVLGIDTSNYTTSLALVAKDGRVLADVRRILEVKEGERGLRQSDALFQHIKNLPELAGTLFEDKETDLCAVAVSTRPRPVEGSYMPVFLAGQAVAESIAQSHGVPCYEVSHQEGHIEAAFPAEDRPKDLKEFYALHLSGGTCELLKVEEKQENGSFSGYSIQIVGGTKDISFGQLLDRSGVAMGFSFPAGREMDLVALSSPPSDLLPPVTCREGWVYLSGIESALLRVLEKEPAADKNSLVSELFSRIGKGISDMTAGRRPVLLVGGISESQTLRRDLAEDERYLFGDSHNGRDNAVGVARLGGRFLWKR